MQPGVVLLRPGQYGPMERPTILVIVARNDGEPHHVQAEAENTRTFEVGEALHVSNLVIQKSAYLELDGSTGVAFKVFKVKKLRPDRTVLNPPV